MRKLLAIALFGCLQIMVGRAQDVDNKFMINGVIYLDELQPNAAGDIVYLYDFHIDGKVIDSTQLTDNGEFTFSGVVQTPYFGAVGIEGGCLVMLTVAVEPGDIKIEINVPYRAAGISPTMLHKVGGTPLNDALQKFNDSLLPILKLHAAIFNIQYSEDLSQDAKDSVIEKIKENIELVSQKAKMDAYNNNKNTILGGKLLVDLLYSEVITPTEFNEMLKSADPALREYSEIKELYRKK